MQDSKCLQYKREGLNVREARWLVFVLNYYYFCLVLGLMSTDCNLTELIRLVLIDLLARLACGMIDVLGQDTIVELSEED